MKNPPRQRGGGLKKSDCSSDSLAVFYVEQVALNRHVSSTHIVVRRYTGVKAFFRGATLGADLFENGRLFR